MRCVVLLYLLALATAALLEPEVDDTVRLKRSDDVGGPLEQQASLIQTLQAELMATKNSLQMLQGSYQTLQATLSQVQDRLTATSKAVAFSARISPGCDTMADGIQLGHHQTVVFDQVVTNIGNAYNPTTGIFTAPLPGVYVFFLNIMSTNNHDGVSIVITKNGAIIDNVYAEGKNDAFDQGAGQVTTHMATGDQVLVRQDGGDAIRGDWWTIFTGYLLQAD